MLSLTSERLLIAVAFGSFYEPACNVGDLDLIPGLGRSPEEWNGYLLQHSGLDNSMDCVVHGVEKSWTRLSLCNKLNIKYNCKTETSY